MAGWIREQMTGGVWWEGRAPAEMLGEEWMDSGVAGLYNVIVPMSLS